MNSTTSRNTLLSLRSFVAERLAELPRSDPAAIALGAILDLHHNERGLNTNNAFCEGCGVNADIDSEEIGPPGILAQCPELRAIAAAWQDHPDYPAILKAAD